MEGSFSCERVFLVAAGGHLRFLISLDLFARVTWPQVLQRSVQMHIMKKDQDQDEFWVRLLKDKVLEKTNVKIDWDKYVDEDEETEGFDTSNLDGGSGFGGGQGG